MGGIKLKGRGPDKQKRKSRARTSVPKVAPMMAPETPKKNILRNIIETVSKKVAKEKFENWSLDIDPSPRSPILGRHVFIKGDETVEINIREL